MRKDSNAWKTARLAILSLFALFAAALLTAPANAAQVAVTVENLTADGGFLAEPTLVPLPYGASAGQVTLSFLATEGITPVYNGGPTSSYFYVKNIAGLGDDGTKGWMITVGNTFIKTSAGVHALKDGDVIRWQYTSNYGRDLGAGDIWEWDFTPTPIPSEKPSKDALILKVAQINSEGNRSAYGSAYTAAMSALTDLAATQQGISAALAGLNAVTPGGTTPGGGTDTDTTPGGDTGTTPGGGTDTGTTPGGGTGTDTGATPGAEAGIMAEPPFIPPADIEKGSGTGSASVSELSALGYGGSVEANDDGSVTFSESAFRNALGSGTQIDAQKPVTPLPVFRTGVTAGKTALVTLRVNLSGYGGETFGSIAVLKITSGGSVRRLDMAASRDKLKSGSYVWTDGSGNVKPSSEKAAAGQSYYISVAIEDDSEYDLDDRHGTIVDPLALAVEGAASGSEDAGQGGGDGWNSSGGGSGGGGGCDSGAFGLSALASLGLTAALRRRGG